MMPEAKAAAADHHKVFGRTEVLVMPPAAAVFFPRDPRKKTAGTRDYECLPVEEQQRRVSGKKKYSPERIAQDTFDAAFFGRFILTHFYVGWLAFLFAPGGGSCRYGTSTMHADNRGGLKAQRASRRTGRDGGDGCGLAKIIPLCRGPARVRHHLRFVPSAPAQDAHSPEGSACTLASPYIFSF